MRKLMWFTIGFAAACGLFACWLPAEELKLYLAVGGVCLMLSVIIGIRYRNLRPAVAICLGCILGGIWYGSYYNSYLRGPELMDGQTRTVTIRTADYSRETEYGIAAETTLSLDGKSYRVFAYLDREEPLEPGYLITGDFRFAMTAPEEDPTSYYSGNGIFLLAFQRGDAIIVKADEEIWKDRIAHLRQWLRDAIHNCLPSDEEPFARALLLGDTSLLDYQTDTDFKVSGIRHVIAVSGLHVSILVALLAAVTFRKRYLMVPVGMGVLRFFAALAGFSPSVNRACIMSGLLLAAMLFNREYDGFTALSFSVLVMLLVNPLVICSVSFQLSVASVAGIFLFDPHIRPWIRSHFPEKPKTKWKQRLAYWFSASVSITVSAMVLTTPLCAYYFGMVSLVGVITNLLALWIISGIFYGIMAVCLIYSFCTPVAMMLGNLLAVPVRYVLGVAHVMANLPLAAVYMDTPYMVMWLVFVYILLFVFLLGSKREPKQLICCAVLGLCLAMLLSWDRPQTTQFTVLDVGQGQCILLQAEGRTYLVDCGGDSDSKAADTAANYLLSRGITRLDGVIVTHLDRDHAGGVGNLLSRIPAEVLILPAEHSELTGKQTVYAAEDLLLTVGEMKLTVYAPTFPGTSNEKSLCVLFETESCDILITGDRDGFGERILLAYADIPEVDILVAGHHGAKSSTCEELLRAVSPEIVCISVDESNDYGHPAPELLDRLKNFGCTVYRTDLHGTITIRR